MNADEREIRQLLIDQNNKLDTIIELLSSSLLLVNTEATKSAPKGVTKKKTKKQQEKEHIRQLLAKHLGANILNYI